MTDTTYALWGRGDLSPESAKALLEEYISDDVGAVYRPEVVDRDHQGLRAALDWFESPDFLGAGGSIPTNDAIGSLLDEQKNHGDEIFLLALWPADPTHEEFNYIEAVQAAGITVFDLSRALHELDLSLYSRPAPTREEKAEAREAAKEEKRGRGRPRKKLSDDAPKDDADSVVSETEVNNVVVPAPRAEIDHEDLKVAVLNEMFNGSTVDDLIKALDAYVESKIVEVLARRAGNPCNDVPVEPLINKNDKDRPPFDPPYVGVDTKPYFWQKSTGNYRPAVGKPRRGETVVNLTQEQIKEKGL